MSAAVVSEMQHPRKVLIVGGGTAGWVTASILRRTAPSNVTITLIESSAIPSVGVGEATLPFIRQVLRYIGIEESEFLHACDGSFKLGIMFRGWNPNRNYWHPFGAVTGPAVLVNDWLRRSGQGTAEPIDEFLAQGTEKIATARLAPQSATRDPFTGDLRVYAYHLDAGRYADLLRTHAVAAGVHHIVDDVTDVQVRPDGWITEVRTARSGPLAADLFFDCTGFRSRLIGQALGEPFIPFGQHLLCDRAVAINIPVEPGERGDLAPYTLSTARSAGWVWEIPLFTRSGNGYVYSSAYQESDDAERELRQHLGIGDELPARHINIRVGKSRRSWVANCVAVGLSGGFIEPLESTGLEFIQDVAEFFVHLAPDLSWDDGLAAQLNSYMDAQYDSVRDFVACHYVSAARDDTQFWRDVRRNPSVRTDGMTQMLEQWHTGDLHALPLANGGSPPFTTYSWAYILGGNELVPERAARAKVDPDALARAREDLVSSRAAVAEVIPKLPDNRERVRELRDRWESNGSSPVAADPSAFDVIPGHLRPGFLTDTNEDLMRAASS